MTDATRDLIQRLADELYNYECLTSRRPPDYIPAPSPLIDEARALLSQPEPEGLTDEEILNLSEEHGVSYTTLGGFVIHPYQEFVIHPYQEVVDIKDDVLSFARAVIAADRARSGRPAIELEAQ